MFNKLSVCRFVSLLTLKYKAPLKLSLSLADIEESNPQWEHGKRRKFHGEFYLHLPSIYQNWKYHNNNRIWGSLVLLSNHQAYQIWI